MWALSENPAAWVPGAVFLASLAGSAHCAGMCGGLVLAVGKGKARWSAYQLGRLAGYLVLGAAFGAAGGTLLGLSPWVSWTSSALLAAALILSGVRVAQGKPLHLSLLPESLLARLRKLGGGGPWVTGLLTAFLPCGWLHVFVLGAAASGSAAQGAALLTAFWLGTLPVLAAVPLASHAAFQRLGLRGFPRVAGLLLVAAGVLTLGVRVENLALQRPAQAQVQAPGTPVTSQGAAAPHSCH